MPVPFPSDGDVLLARPDAEEAMLIARGLVSAMTSGDPDSLRIEWFEHADLPVDEARRRFGIGPKSQAALESGSVGPWEPGGISLFQAEAGRRAAEAAGRGYASFGATPVS